MTVTANDLRPATVHTAALPSETLSPATLPRVCLFGATIASITEQECVQVILNELRAGRGGWLMTLNLDHLRRFVRVPSFAEMTGRATFVVADGMPLIWASHLQATPLPQRVTGSNLIWSLSAGASENGQSVFLLGGDANTAAQSAAQLKGRYPALVVSGVYAPPFGFDQDPVEIEKLLEAVRRARPDIFFVALGSPKQDALIQELRAVLPTAWCLGVGVSFSWVAGAMPRAPQWMQHIGLEWLHRLIQEPRRLMRRYVIDDLPFAFELAVNALQMRFRRNRTFNR